MKKKVLRELRNMSETNENEIKDTLVKDETNNKHKNEKRGKNANNK